MREQVFYRYDREADGPELHPDRAREVISLLGGDLADTEKERDSESEHPGHRATRRIASGQFLAEAVAEFSALVDTLAERRRAAIAEVEAEGARIAADEHSRRAYRLLSGGMRESLDIALGMRDAFVAAFEASRIPGH